ncbi:bidirectional sugar transporter [Musa troglodytarum]|uniref:Bidirectional sugar transporter n=1 Tax=Musa troglodytarum TaxID=320322 RepID=A0A9E7JQE2_9LILI|nr:bidirectional sugar transporter [Musa troglodytarum]
MAPVPTICKIYQNKSAEGYSSLSYNLSLFSCLIWVYYAHLKPNSVLLISINAIGCLILTSYITIYLVFATRKDRIFTLQVFVALNLVTFIGILFLTLLLFSGTNRLTVLGWICVGFSISVYAAPMSTIVQRRVVRTRSVEFMPVNVLVCLTLSAAVWLGYGVFTKDAFISVIITST